MPLRTVATAKRESALAQLRIGGKLLLQINPKWGVGHAKSSKAEFVRRDGVTHPTQHALDLVELSRRSNCLRAGRPSGFGLLHPPGQGQSYCHFQAWQGSRRRNPRTGRILRRGCADGDTAMVDYNHHNVDMRDHTVRD